MRRKILGLIVIGMILSFTHLAYMGFRPAEAQVSGDAIWTRTSNPSTRADSAYDVAVDSAGLYVVGFDGTGGNSEWRIEKRKLGDGSIIWSQTENPSNLSDEARGVAVDSTGLYVVGFDSSLDELFSWN